MSILFLYLFLFHLAVISVSLYLAYRQRKSSSNVKLPPGSKGWPFIGENLEFMMASQSGQLDKFVNDRTSKYAQDVFRTSLLGENMAVFCGATGHKLLFTSEKKYVATWLPKSIVKLFNFTDSKSGNVYDEESTIIHLEILSSFLKPQGLQGLIPVMDSMAKEHLKMDWFPHNEVKVYPLLKDYTFSLAFRLFMGVKDHQIVRKFASHFSIIAAGLFSVPINFPGTPYNKALKAGKVIFPEILSIIMERKMELSAMKDVTSQDLLTRVLLYNDENGRSVNEREMGSTILGVIFASHDTLSAAVTFVLKFLAEHPLVYDKVFQEQMKIAKSKDPNELLKWDDVQKMKYTWCVVCETMRLLPPSQGTFREAITDFVAYEGFTIPKGWKIYWTVHSTHKNPKYFEDPEKFDPSRFEGHGPAPYTFVPFGGGPHICPGKEYARLAILVFIHNVVTKFKWKKVLADEKIRIEISPIPVNGFPVHLEPL